MNVKIKMVVEMSRAKTLGKSSINVKKNFRLLKLRKYKNVKVMAKDLSISENYIYQIISMKTDKVPSIPLLEFISQKWNIEITDFFKDVNVEEEEIKLKH